MENFDVQTLFNLLNHFTDHALLYAGAIFLAIHCIFGLTTLTIHSNRGLAGGFWWGFWFGILGIVVSALRPKD